MAKYNCNICDKEFNNKDTYIKHLKSTLRQAQSIDDSDEN